MNTSGWLQLALYLGILLLITKPLGIYLFQVLDGKNTFLEPVLGPLERLTYRLLRVDAQPRTELETVRGRHRAFQPGDDALHLRGAASCSITCL